MLDDILELFKIIFEGLCGIGFIIVLVILLFIVSSKIPCVDKFFAENDRINKEWDAKVNNCVLNKNYRKDCTLILYREKQFRDHLNRPDTTVMPMPLYIGR